MDQYSLHIYGTDLAVDQLIKVLHDFSVQRICRKDMTHFELHGGVKNNVRNAPFERSSVDFDAKGMGLLDLLTRIEDKLSALDILQIEEIEVWALLEREGQINGELSSEEISKLSSIGASYCWSVI